jgi:CheY-like chemotaxis protein
MAGSRDLCLDAGMDDYLTKPLRMEELTHTLQKWILKWEHAPATVMTQLAV